MEINVKLPLIFGNSKTVDLKKVIKIYEGALNGNIMIFLKSGEVLETTLNENEFYRLWLLKHTEAGERLKFIFCKKGQNSFTVGVLAGVRETCDEAYLCEDVGYFDKIYSLELYNRMLSSIE